MTSAEVGDATPSVSMAGVVKRFGHITAVDEVSLTIGRGEVFGMIGPDGAGKTTLLRMLVTLLAPDAGRASVLGLDTVRDRRALRRRVGYMAGRFSLYPDLTVEENLRFFASVFGTTLEREHARIAPIYGQLAPFGRRRAAALSGGMKQKLALCCALVHRPEILFLDEPTLGVDAVSRREMWDVLAGLKRDGLTIVVSTGYMDEASQCDRVALVLRGRVLAVDTPARIAASVDRPLFGVRTSDRYAALLALRRLPHTHSVYLFGAVLHYADVRVDAPAARVIDDLHATLRDRGFADVDVAVIAPSVEDAFIARMATAAPSGEGGA